MEPGRKSQLHQDGGFFDICVNSNLSGLGDMYWQTSNPAVIKGFLFVGEDLAGI